LHAIEAYALFDGSRGQRGLNLVPIPFIDSSGSSSLETFYEAKPGQLSASSIALGFFDGVHLGHQVVIGNAVRRARELGVVPGVVTFRDHPRTLTQGVAPLLLTVIEQRLALFEKLGVEKALVLSFNEELCRLSPQEYVENILVGSMGAKSISVGYNHHFGRDREGNPDLLQALGRVHGYDVQIAPAVYIDGLEVSSSKIRECLTDGNMDLAKTLLSRPYALYGQVVEGDGRGKKVGFPTANLSLYEFQALPKTGVYAGTASFKNGRPLPCVINAGYRPTFKKMQRDAEKQGSTEPGPEKQSEIVVEVHIFDLDQDLYGKWLDISFHKFLRPEQKFAGIDELRTQIASDCASAREFLAKEDLLSAENAQAAQKAHA
jgi:riboflavin kinase/FMN adenylyltransferase